MSMAHRPVEPVGLMLVLPAAGTLPLAVFDAAVPPLSLPGLLGSEPLPQPLFIVDIHAG